MLFWPISQLVRHFTCIIDTNLFCICVHIAHLTAACPNYSVMGCPVFPVLWTTHKNLLRQISILRVAVHAAKSVWPIKSKLSGYCWLAFSGCWDFQSSDSSHGLCGKCIWSASESHAAQDWKLAILHRGPGLIWVSFNDKVPPCILNSEAVTGSKANLPTSRQENDWFTLWPSISVY